MAPHHYGGLCGVIFVCIALKSLAIWEIGVADKVYTGRGRRPRRPIPNQAIPAKLDCVMMRGHAGAQKRMKRLRIYNGYSVAIFLYKVFCAAFYAHRKAMCSITARNSHIETNLHSKRYYHETIHKQIHKSIF